MSKIILGIDPGTALLGYGLIEQLGNRLNILHHGCIKTKSTDALEIRLAIIYKELQEVISEHEPDEIAIEKIFFSKNVKTAISVAQARGVIMLTAAHAKVSIAEYTPNQVKQAVCGYGSADKRQVQEMVKRLLGLREIVKPDDAADALAIAICHSSYCKELKIKK